MLPIDVGPDKLDAQSPTVPTETELINDVVIATAIAHAVRGIPGVVDVGQGVFAQAATYGPGKHIAGIVLRRPAPGELSVEVHVVVDEAMFFKALSDGASSENDTPILLRFTDMIRVVVAQTFEHLGLPAPTMIDVTIDDIW